MVEKGYVIGFSSGMYMTASQEEKEQFLTMPRKFFKGALEGVTFTQVDIESVNEFNEPLLKEGMKRMKDLGLRLGFHGESYAMGGAEKPIGMLDSCIESDYVHAHERLIEHINGCGGLGGEYVNIHPSETTPFIKLGLQLQPARLVDPWGRPLATFLEENKKILEWAVIAVSRGWISASHLGSYQRWGREDVCEERGLKWENLSPVQKAEVYREATARALLKFVDSNELEYGAERIAYILIARWMQENKDQLWRDIVGKYIPDDKLLEKHRDWVPAVASKYIWGHFNPKTYQDPKPLLEKYKLYFAFETQMGSAGLEGLQRLSRPRDMTFLCKAIGSPYATVCFDFEHVLSQNMNPRKEIESIPNGQASYIKVLHLGWPTPHVPAHMPIPLGSEAQYYLYELLFELRKKGMMTGYFIFERAGEARGTTILTLRAIKQFLEKDVPPKELPLEFFGMEENGPDIKGQEVSMREHFLDPLKGMLVVPEEEYTFLSKAATEKGKAELWKKEQFR